MRAGVRQRSAEWAVRAGITTAQRAAYCRADDLLIDWAVSQRASLYIAHTHPVLAVAAEAARRTGAAFAFDCEDLLAEEAADGGLAPWRRTMIHGLEGRYLPGAAYVSATSEPMAAFLREKYALQATPVWHNCFPRAESANLAPPTERSRLERTELAWMSATIGPGRGLEDAFAALRAVGGGMQLHLYGTLPAGLSSWFSQQAGSLVEDETVVVHALPPAAQVMSTLARHHVGLTLDPNDCLNRSLTICNKLFLYLQAGLACVATDTPGQRSIFSPDSPGGFVYAPGDVGALGAILTRLRTVSTRVAAQQAAWDLGHARYVWEVECPRFLDVVERATGRTASREALSA
jgi:hypothetical protein